MLRSGLRFVLRSGVASSGLGLALLLGLTGGAAGPASTAQVVRVRDSAASRLDPLLFSRQPSLYDGELRLGALPPLSAGFVRVAAMPEPVPAPLAAAAPSQDLPRTARAVPLPVPRPAEFSAAASPARPAVRTASRRQRIADRQPAAAPEGSFLERMLGLSSETGPTAAYAALPSDPAVAVTRPAAPAPSAEPGVAIYDISARTVTLPNGERLEAHSGLGAYLDDPAAVHLRMRGATPPGTYDLSEREALFHGVRALRLNPVGGAGAIHNRAGLLTHTFMLGPNGDSNGCISFRDYNRFLQAYLRGEVIRIVVVAGEGRGLGGFARRIFGAAAPGGDRG